MRAPVAIEDPAPAREVAIGMWEAKDTALVCTLCCISRRDEPAYLTVSSCGPSPWVLTLSPLSVKLGQPYLTPFCSRACAISFSPLFVFILRQRMNQDNVVALDPDITTNLRAKLDTIAGLRRNLDLHASVLDASWTK